MGLIYQRPWTRQPQFASGLNPRFARNLILLCAPSQSATLIGDYILPNLARPGQSMPYVYSNGTLSAEYSAGVGPVQMRGVASGELYQLNNTADGTLNTAFAATGEASCLAVLRANAQDAVGDNGPLRISAPGIVSGEHYPYTDGNVYLGPFSTTRWVVVTPPVDVFKPHVTIVTHRNVEQAFYMGGKLLTEASLLETPSVNSGARIGFNGAVAMFAFWSRVLSRAEIFELSINPWQLFAPLPRMLWAPSGPAAPAPVGTLGQWDPELRIAGWF